MFAGNANFKIHYSNEASAGGGSTAILLVNDVMQNGTVNEDETKLYYIVVPELATELRVTAQPGMDIILYSRAGPPDIEGMIYDFESGFPFDDPATIIYDEKTSPPIIPGQIYYFSVTNALRIEPVNYTIVAHVTTSTEVSQVPDKVSFFF